MSEKHVTLAEGSVRCRWAAEVPAFFSYHDSEWGFPVQDDQQLFEKLCLESFQSGLSWRTILGKRESFRAAFHGFDFTRIARMGERDVERLLKNEGIVRHRGKIEATINNAKRACEMVEAHGSIAAYFWRFEPAPNALAPPLTVNVCPESVALSKALKKLGWAFVGPTTLYAMMQAAGLVNDHAETCSVRVLAERARKRAVRPAR